MKVWLIWIAVPQLGHLTLRRFMLVKQLTMMLAPMTMKTYVQSCPGARCSVGVRKLNTNIHQTVIVMALQNSKRLAISFRSQMKVTSRAAGSDTDNSTVERKLIVNAAKSRTS